MQVVELHQTDTIHTSLESVAGNVFGGDITGSTYDARSAGRRWDEWYEGF